MTEQAIPDRAADTVRRHLPGLAVVLIGVGAAYGVNQLVSAAGTLTLAIALGVVTGHTGLRGPRTERGIGFASRSLLRAGIVVLGLQLAIPQLLELRPADLAVIGVTVAVTFAGTRYLGRWVGVGGDRALLVATGFSICGASAIAAISGVTESDDEDVTAAIALVTLYGSLAMVTFPLLQPGLGLADDEFGIWVGASVQEVAHVVAAASAVAEAALVVAVLAKLGRVVLLAPMVAAVGLTRRHRHATPLAGRRPPVVPGFVLGFLGAIAARSLGVVPEPVVHAAGTVTTALLAAAMFGLGTGVHLPTLARTGGRAALLGAASTILAAGTAYAGILVAR